MFHSSSLAISLVLSDSWVRYFTLTVSQMSTVGLFGKLAHYSGESVIPFFASVCENWC